MGEPLLRSDERKRLGERIELLAEAPLEIGAAGCPIGGQALLEPVLAEGRIPQRVTQGVHDDARRRRVIVARPEIDDVHPRIEQAALDRGDLRQGVSGKRRQPRARANGHLSYARTELRRMPTPGISTSTTSPGASGPVPAGVPVATRSPGSSVMTSLI